MVALLHPQPTRRPQPIRPASPPKLRLVQGHASPKHPLVQLVEDQPRRVAAWAMVGLCILGSFLMLRSMQAVPGSALAPRPAAVEPVGALPTDSEIVHVVQQGETLWAIASELAPGVDPRPLIDRLADRNGGSAIQVGQRLVVPSDHTE